ncbi:hypothetical protein [Streptomyces microflavus]|uniref:hypothetical protein n=1 Tax=Streptomyces microflavus TaxID=1919 RepID=UPI00367867F0
MTSSPPPPDASSQPFWKKHPKETIAGFFGIAIALIGLLGLLISNDFFGGDSKPSASESAPAPVTALPTPAATGSPTPLPTPSESIVSEDPTTAPPDTSGGGTGETNLPDPAVQYLTQDGPIGGYGNNKRKDSAQLSDGFYDQSIVFSPSVHSKNLQPLSFNVSPGLKKFQATVGLDTETMPDYVAQVKITDRNGATIKTLTLRSGQSYEVNEDISNTNLITIAASVTRWSNNAINHRPHIVVGDGRFTQ